MPDTFDVAAVRTVADGLGLVEAPTLVADDRILVASVSRGCLYSIELRSGRATLLVEVGGTPSGLAVAADGGIVIAQGGARAELRSRSRLPAAPSLQHYDGRAVRTLIAGGLDCPNDCAIGPDGRIWFTDPRGHALVDDASPGRLCSYQPGAREVGVHADRLQYPNGIGFSADGEWLYVAETAGSRITRFRWDSVTSSEGELFCATPGRPDGLAVDTDGTVYAALVTEDRIAVLTPTGDLVAVIELPAGAFPTSVCLGPRPGTTLLVTGGRGGRIFEIRLPRRT
jgi:gluconolactonase